VISLEITGTYSFLIIDMTTLGNKKKIETVHTLCPRNSFFDKSNRNTSLFSPRNVFNAFDES
jgi:hypothetical protein